MRSLLLAITFITLPCSFARAQQIVLGVNGGAALNGQFVNKNHVFTNDAKYSRTSINPTASFKAGISKKNIEFGLLVATFKFSYPIDSRYSPFSGPSFEPWHVPFEGYDEYVWADKALSIQFYVNRKATIAGIEAYYGFAIGQGKFFLDNPGGGNEDHFSPNHEWKTFNLSAQLGGTYYINKHLGINIEATGNYIVPFDLKADTYKHLYSVPITAGVRYRIL